MSPRDAAGADEDLEELIEEATMDAASEGEAAAGFLVMLEEEVELPFEVELLGVVVEVVELDLRDEATLAFRCQRGPDSLWVDARELPLPAPPPGWCRWVRAYRRWKGEG